MRLGSGKSVAPLNFPALAQVRAYWEGVRDEGRVPFRGQIDPRGIEDALGQSFLLERIAPGLARFRIAGMHLADLMGMDVRGMPVSAMVEPSARAGFAVALETVFAGPSMLEMELEAERGIGRPALAARLLVLPLADELGLVRLALGCLVTDGAMGRSPRRFVTVRQTISPMQTSRGLRLADLEKASLSTPRPQRARPGHPHLRLVTSNA